MFTLSPLTHQVTVARAPAPIEILAAKYEDALEVFVSRSWRCPAHQTEIGTRGRAVAFSNLDCRRLVIGLDGRSKELVYVLWLLLVLLGFFVFLPFVLITDDECWSEQESAHLAAQRVIPSSSWHSSWHEAWFGLALLRTVSLVALFGGTKGTQEDQKRNKNKPNGGQISS